MTEHVFTVDRADADKRLDMYLVERFPNRTRSQLQKQIKSGLIFINTKPATVHQFLKTGDQIEIMSDPVLPPPGKVRAGEGSAPSSPAPTILAETDDWMVIDKPAGLLVHPTGQKTQRTENVAQRTLVDFLIDHYPAIVKVGEDPSRPGIVHRLDREVSGLMVIAKTQAAYESLKKQFGQKQVGKHYLALVHGEMSKDIGDIKFRIARSTSKARMAARPKEEEGGKAAWTHYQVLRRFTGATLVELQILSGRTHQIRAHMHAMQHPIVGDTLYALRRTDRNLEPKRLLLQSVGLVFHDPTTGERREFHLEPDIEFGLMEKELGSIL